MVRRSARPAVVPRAHFANDARGDTEHQGPCRGGEALGEHAELERSLRSLYEEWSKLAEDAKS